MNLIFVFVCLFILIFSFQKFVYQDEKELVNADIKHIVDILVSATSDFISENSRVSANTIVKNIVESFNVNNNEPVTSVLVYSKFKPNEIIAKYEDKNVNKDLSCLKKHGEEFQLIGYISPHAIDITYDICKYNNIQKKKNRQSNITYFILCIILISYNLYILFIFRKSLKLSSEIISSSDTKKLKNILIKDIAELTNLSIKSSHENISFIKNKIESNINSYNHDICKELNGIFESKNMDRIYKYANTIKEKLNRYIENILDKDSAKLHDIVSLNDLNSILLDNISFAKTIEVELNNANSMFKIKDIDYFKRIISNISDNIKSHSSKEQSSVSLSFYNEQLILLSTSKISIFRFLKLKLRYLFASKTSKKTGEDLFRKGSIGLHNIYDLSHKLNGVFKPTVENYSFNYEVIIPLEKKPDFNKSENNDNSATGFNEDRNKIMRIFVVDDENEIHDIWTKINLNYKFKLYSFKEPENIKQKMLNFGFCDNDILVLDYMYDYNELTSLIDLDDLIETFEKLKDNIYICTSLDIKGLNIKIKNSIFKTESGISNFLQSIG